MEEDDDDYLIFKLTAQYRCCTLQMEAILTEETILDDYTGNANRAIDYMKVKMIEVIGKEIPKPKKESWKTRLKKRIKNIFKKQIKFTKLSIRW